MNCIVTLEIFEDNDPENPPIYAVYIDDERIYEGSKSGAFTEAISFLYIPHADYTRGYGEGYVAALEEAAKVADAELDTAWRAFQPVAMAIAAAIRALRDTP